MGRANAPLQQMILKNSEERRRYPRLPIQLPVVVIGRRGRRELLTDDINRGGLFVRTDEPGRVRELLEVAVDIGNGEVIESVAVVRHLVSPEVGARSGRAPGMGVQFFGMGRTAMARWEEFVDEVADAQDDEADPRRAPEPASPFSGRDDMSIVRKRRELELAANDAPTPVVPVDPAALEAGTFALPDGFRPGKDSLDTPAVPDLPRAQAPDQTDGGPHDPIRRMHPRFASAFTVRMPDAAALEVFATRDISAGGIFLATDRVIAIGERVRVVVVHPETKGEFELAGEVVRVSEKSARTPAGLGIRFVDVDASARERLDRFVRSAIPDELFAVGDFLFEDHEFSKAT